MNFSVIIPHYKSKKITAYSIAQMLKHKGGHLLDIIVVDNSAPDDSIKSLDCFGCLVRIINGNTGNVNSQGTALSLGAKHAYYDWIICAESDSFPTSKEWLNYYAALIEQGYECAGSKLTLSGGQYIHPCGMLVKKANIESAEKFCKEMPFSYFPNLYGTNDFAYHGMIHNDILEQFLQSPEDYVELSESYKPFNREVALMRRDSYRDVVCAFHNGMGYKNEDVHTYGRRTIESESPTLEYKKGKMFKRVGAEPGQFLSWWHHFSGKNVFNVPIETVWMPGRESQQQEYTLMQNGFKHIWAGTSYESMKGTSMNDVYEFKRNQIHELYESLPHYQKVNL